MSFYQSGVTLAHIIGAVPSVSGRQGCRPHKLSRKKTGGYKVRVGANKSKWRKRPTQLNRYLLTTKRMACRSSKMRFSLGTPYVHGLLKGIWSGMP